MTKKSKTALKIGTKMADGSVYAGMTADGTQQIYAMPNDLDICMTFNDASKAVRKLNKEKSLGHDDWKIPDIDTLRVLYENQDKGALKDTFTKEAGRYGDNISNMYLSSMKRQRSYRKYLWEIRFSYGDQYLSPKDVHRSACRPVRMVASAAPSK